MPQTAEQWIQIISALVVGLIIPGYFAWKRGKLNDFLVQKMEPGLTKGDKADLKEEAITAGVQGILKATLIANGLSRKDPPSKAPPAAVLLILLLPALAACLTGCGRSAQEAVLRESFSRYCDTGEAIVPLVVADTPGEKALLDAFVEQLAAGRALEGR